MNKVFSKLKNPWSVALLAVLFFVPFLGKVHLFDWDEINFAESAREMLLTGNYLRVQIDFKPFWEKPPLFIWLQVLSMKVFGVNEFAARFPNAVVGVLTLLSFFYIGKRLHNAQFGFLWALAYLGSVTPHLYFKSGIIDPWFNFFMFWSVVNLTPCPFSLVRGGRYAARERAQRGGEVANPEQRANLTPSPLSLTRRGEEAVGRRGEVLLAGIFAGLAVWTKGPVGVGIPTLTLAAVWALNRFKPVISFKNLLIYAAAAGILTLGWMAAIILESGWATFLAFLEYLYRLGATSEADHGQPFYYHFVVVLIGCFPISVLGLRYVGSFRKFWNNQTTETSFTVFMFCLFWVVMIVFSIVKTKIVHYSSMAYFPLSYLAALWLYRWLKGEFQWPRWMTALLLLVGFVLALALTFVPLAGMYAPVISPYIDDKFAVANLQAPVEWQGYEWLFGVGYFVVIVAVVIIRSNRKILAIRLLFFSTAVLMFVYTAVVVPNIEGYTQRTVIDFYEAKRGQDIYVWPVGFHSYAQYFYFRKPTGVRPEASDENWLLNGPVDKPTFLITRIDRAEPYRTNPNLEFFKEENGFVFFRRKGRY
ncbi:MAG: glycosyltransferase family 39 protein [Spirosomaceae bacterium]|jgi:4-amino-4-deoxy-L-arabinose transferase-like glycosyltransferase|nr:glycosyltransferase family 39 protein [Spirosomataceae bacterium]